MRPLRPAQRHAGPHVAVRGNTCTGRASRTGRATCSRACLRRRRSPAVFWAWEPSVLARTAGRRPRTKVSEVMTTGRSRNLAPRITASLIDMPALRTWLKYQINRTLFWTATPKTDEANGRGDRKRHPGQPQAPDVPHGRRQHVQDHKEGIVEQPKRLDDRECRAARVDAKLDGFTRSRHAFRRVRQGDQYEPPGRAVPAQNTTAVRSST